MENEKWDLERQRKLELIKIASTDPLFLADIKEINEDFKYIENQ